MNHISTHATDTHTADLHASGHTPAEHLLAGQNIHCSGPAPGGRLPGGESPGATEMLAILTRTTAEPDPNQIASVSFPFGADIPRDFKVCYLPSGEAVAVIPGPTTTSRADVIAYLDLVTAKCMISVRELRRLGVVLDPATEDRIEEALLEFKARTTGLGDVPDTLSGGVLLSGVDEAEAALDPVKPVFDAIDAAGNRGAMLLENAEPGFDLAHVVAQPVETGAQCPQVLKDQAFGAIGHDASLPGPAPECKPPGSQPASCGQATVPALPAGSTKESREGQTP